MLTATTDKTPKGLIGLCKKHMSLDVEFLKDFADGYKKLTEKDKAEFKAEFESYGYIIKYA